MAARSDVIREICKRKPYFFASDVERIVRAINKAIEHFLLEGKHIELRSFGVFAPKKLKQKEASNPRGGRLFLPARTSVKFKAGKRLLRLVNGDVSSD
ncbi:MAG: HU family DNA-binding protein [Rickettsiales bacterium]|jgi:nucleoid DNA-binding protein|nr:HU family DNA-binding protein [Rickettsiales bacterium]